MAATIERFISEFERKFRPILREVKPDPTSGARYTDFFECFEPRKKYSDWDLKCSLKEEAVTVENLKSRPSRLWYPQRSTDHGDM